MKHDVGNRGHGGKEEERRRLLRRRVLIALLIVGIVIAIALLAKTYLFVSLLLGNDIIISLTQDTTHMELVHGEELDVTFTASVTTNPFCKAECTSTFDDLSDGTTWDVATFRIRPAVPMSRTYSISADHPGRGQDLYRFSMQCTGVSTLFCHTTGVPTSRDVLLTVEYDLTAEEETLRTDLKTRLQEVARDFASLSSRRETLARTDALLKERTGETLLMDLPVLDNAPLTHARATWDEERYDALLAETEAIERDVALLSRQLDDAEASLAQGIARYNLMTDTLFQAYDALASTRVTDPSHAMLLANETASLAAVAGFVGSPGLIAPREAAAEGAAMHAEATIARIISEQEPMAFNVSFDTFAVLDATCLAVGCADPPSFAWGPATLEGSCATAAAARERLLTSGNVSDPRAIVARDARQDPLLNLSAPYGYLPTNATSPTIAGGDLPVFVASLAQLIPECVWLNASLVTLPPITRVGFAPTVPSTVVATFPDQSPRCCIRGECQSCCTPEVCADDPLLTPIIFLHGHAFSDGISAEYSLDAFNSIQRALEEDGYLNAGTVTLYTERDTPVGVLGKTVTPLTLKTSYYFDVFEEPENYIVVQTKSESIDTYAIRVKELLETVRQKTGRDKVIIVAHSMGGLVARRYIDLFGTGRVDRIIMIGTPNHGISGNTHELCPWVGEQLECRDMAADSLFLNKLNRHALPDIPITIIIGRGCDTGGEDGDGVVTTSSAALDGAENIYIDGSCSTFSTLHTEMLDVDLYPEVYSELTRALT